MNIYLAAKMSGIPKWNFPEMDRVKKDLEKRGHVVTSPADIVKCLGLKEDDEVCSEKILRTVTEINLCVLINFANAMAIIPDGWETSKGLAVEIALCKSLQIPILNAVDELKPFQV
jgi:hypothetical protein